MEELEYAVKFILHGDNVGTLSWGQKEIRLDKYESILLPRLIRKKTKKGDMGQLQVPV